jgi:RNA polymerase sigma-70 factor, ECF subfamily
MATQAHFSPSRPIPLAARQRLQELYVAHAGAIHARCRRLLGDRASAEDAAQETFLRVRRYLDSGPAADDLLPLIHRIATNYCLKLLRNKAARARLLALGTAADPDVFHDPELVFCRARFALERLPGQTQRVAWLTYVAGMTQAEVARALGISRRTVVNRLGELGQAA